MEILGAITETLAAARRSGLPDSVSPLAADQQTPPPFRPRDLPETSLDRSVRLEIEYRKSVMQEPRLTRLKERGQLALCQKNVWPELVSTIKAHDVTIIAGTTGSGKTTQTPQLILDQAISRTEGALCNIIVTQPRRIATTSVARSVAYERAQPLQKSVGYQVRNDSRLPEQGGNITYCTTGVLLQRLLYSPDKVMESYSHFILDEVHERDVPIDFPMNAVRRTMKDRRLKSKTNPKIILMSATIDTESFEKYFGQTDDNIKIASVRVTGARSAPALNLKHLLPQLGAPSESLTKANVSEEEAPQVTTHYLGDILPSLLKAFGVTTLSSIFEDGKYDKATRPYIEAETTFAKTGKDPETDTFKYLNRKPLEALCPISLVAAVIAHIVKTTDSGGVLYFLPGFWEIDRTLEVLRESQPLGVNFSDRSRFRIHKLHSQLYETNDEVFEDSQSGQRRIVLSTNIAETSITLPDIQYVVDTGKVRQAMYDPVTASTSLPCTWISKTNSIQRRGRAGRVLDGHYYALFSKERYDALPQTVAP